MLHHIQNYLGRLRRGSTQVQQKQPSTSKGANTNSDSDGEDDDDQMEGYWQRRRRLDGALNRVPLGFYTKVIHSTYSIDIKNFDDPTLPQGMEGSGEMPIAQNANEQRPVPWTHSRGKPCSASPPWVSRGSTLYNFIHLLISCDQELSCPDACN